MGTTTIDEDALGTVRTLLYPVQYERDPASPKAVDWVVAEVVEGDETGLSPAGYLEHVQRTLEFDGDLAAALQGDAHDDAQIRAFLRALAARLERGGPGPG